MPSDFKTNPDVKEALSAAIADTLQGVDKEHVTITEIRDGRRLGLLEDSYRRLSSDVSVLYEINLPSTYSGDPITTTSFNADTLKTNINAQLTAKSVSASVSSLEVKDVQSVTVTTTDRGSANSAFISSGLPSVLTQLISILCIQCAFASCLV
jgi:hypothetical protein